MPVSTHNTTSNCSAKAACTIKFKVQAVVLSVGILLLAGKFLAYMLTDSVGILTDAMESIVNVVAGAMGLWSVWMAAIPRHYTHPYGHGKVELLTASVEGILIIVAGGVIIYEGFTRILTPQMPQQLDIGIIIVAAAGAVNCILGLWSIRIGKRNNSMALIAGGKHLLSDTYSTIGLVLGLTLLYFLKWPWIDGALALVFGAVIIVTGVGIIRQTASNLIDTTDGKIVARITTSIENSRQADWIDVHDLRAINYGEMMHIDCHLTLPYYYSIKIGHQRCDELEDVLRSAVEPHTTLISVHSDPCDERMCGGCAVGACEVRKAPFSKLNELNINVVTEDDDARAERLTTL